MTYDTSAACAEGTQANTTVRVKRSLVAVEMRHVRHSLGTLVSAYVPGGPVDHELSRPGPFEPELVFAPDSRAGVLPVPLTAPGVYGALLENMGSATEQAEPTEIPY